MPAGRAKVATAAPRKPKFLPPNEGKPLLVLNTYLEIYLPLLSQGETLFRIYPEMLRNTSEANWSLLLGISSIFFLVVSRWSRANMTSYMYF